MVPVTVVIPTLDEAESIGACLQSVAWAAEVIVVDGGSKDDTVRIARSLGAVVTVAAGATIGGQRNRGIELAAGAWILALDADERAGEDLKTSVANAIRRGRDVVYAVRRRNRFLGREMRWGGWGADWVERLFPVSERYDDRRVHERLDSGLPTERIRGTIVHDPYRDLDEFESKLDRYADWGAAELAGRGWHSLRFAALVRPPLRVLRMLVLQLGLLDGTAGIRLALLSGRSVRRKYRRACELARRS